jgi:hypothetical protein
MDRYNISDVERLQTRLQICRAYRFFPVASTEGELEAIIALNKKYGECGGMTPEISKIIGWYNTYGF